MLKLVLVATGLAFIVVLVTKMREFLSVAEALIDLMAVNESETTSYGSIRPLESEEE